MEPQSYRLQGGLHLRGGHQPWLRFVSGIDWQRLLFAALLVLIMSISVHDAALVVMNHGVIADVEQNPLGRWLLHAGGGDVWLFVGLKLLGTATAAALSIEVLCRAPRIAWAAVTAVAAFQVSLLAYLSLV